MAREHARSDGHPGQGARVGQGRRQRGHPDTILFSRSTGGAGAGPGKEPRSSEAAVRGGRSGQVGPAREEIIDAINRLDASGDTALYDAIGIGSILLEETSSPETTNALVVLTDGQDTYSYRFDFNQELIDMAAANDTTVFTIAYGDDADQEILSELAFGANT